jgi:hypothetical protein
MQFGPKFEVENLPEKFSAENGDLSNRFLAELVDSAGELDSCARLSRRAAVSPSVKLKKISF